MCGSRGSEGRHADSTPTLQLSTTSRQPLAVQAVLLLVVMHCRMVRRQLRGAMDHANLDGATGTGWDMTSRIRNARREREWSQTRLIAELQRVARRRDISLPSLETMKSRVSRWENGHATPDDFYRQLLREAFGMDDRELGFESQYDEPLAAAVDELQLRLALGKSADGALLGALRCQTDAVRVQDRQFGAGLLLEQMRGHVHNLESHLASAVFERARQQIAQILADAAALAGWQALDVGAIDQAWRSFQTATSAARQADDKQLFGFARLEQAHVLADMGHAGAAADLALDTWESVAGDVSGTVRCWMAAATADMLAGDSRSGQALAMVRRSEALVDELSDEKPAYLVFDQIHLSRWIGHTLVKLHDPAAEPILRTTFERLDESFRRASASMNLDLAESLLQRDENAEAVRLLGKGEELARAVGSRRQLRRAQGLRAAS